MVHVESVAGTGHADKGQSSFDRRIRQAMLHRRSRSSTSTHRATLPNPIGWSDYEAAWEAARYLASLGHRAVAGIYGAAAVDGEPGFAAGAAATGLDLVEYLELDEPFDYESQAEYVEFFLGSGYRLGWRGCWRTSRATAVFVRNDVLAAGALQALRDAGIAVRDRFPC